MSETTRDLDAAVRMFLGLGHRWVNGVEFAGLLCADCAVAPGDSDADQPCPAGLLESESRWPPGPPEGFR